MSIEEFITKVKKAETPFYSRLNRVARRLMRWEVPCTPIIHSVLYWERSTRIGLWRDFWRAFYYQPLFRSRCNSCGNGFRIARSGHGIPVINGDIKIDIGDNVSIHDRASIIALPIGNRSKLTIGDNTDVASPISMFIGNEISIGAYCIIAGSLIADNPGHRMDYKERRNKRIEPGTIGKVKIGDDVWVGQRSFIVGNVTIGDGAVIGSMAFVKKDIPPFCVVGGVPARIIKKLPFPDEMIEKVGKEQYQKYLDAKIGD